MLRAEIVICCLLLLVQCAASISLVDDHKNATQTSTRVLSRKKRFLVFPTGSSFSVAVCMTVGVYGNPQFSIWSWAVNYGFAYNLPTNSTEFTQPTNDIKIFPFYDPDDTTTATTDAPAPPDSHEAFTDSSIVSQDHNRRQFYVYSKPSWETQPMMHRRYRRDIYRNIEAVIDKMGYNGRDCVLQALCESSLQFGDTRQQKKKRKKRTMVQELIRTVFSMPKSNVLPFEHSDLSVYDKAYKTASSEESCAQSYEKCGFSLIKMILGKYSEKPVSFM